MDKINEKNRTCAVSYTHLVDADITYGKYVIKAGSDIIVSFTGKLRISGKGVKVDGVKYDITSSTTSSSTWKVDSSKNQD